MTNEGSLAVENPAQKFSSMAFLSRATQLKLWSRFYMPFVGAGIRVTKVTPDFREMEVRMKLKWYNKNYVGTHYGGSIYSMTDPFYMLMLIQILGNEYLVWDKAASIEFLKPGKTELSAKFNVSDETLEEILSKTKDGSKHFAEFAVDVTDVMGETVAKVNKTIYVKKRSGSTHSKL